MMTYKTREGYNAVEVATEIASDPGSVWKALTDTAELVRWFPLAARVTPGIGGSIWLSWGDSISVHSRITIWEPEKHLRTVEISEFGRKIDHSTENPLIQESTAATECSRAIDYFLARSEKHTVLRVRHSGFNLCPVDHSARVLASIRRGWVFELLSLKQYVETHWGRPRSVAWVRRILNSEPKTIWSRMIGPSGLLVSEKSRPLTVGSNCVLRYEAGDLWEVSVHIADPPMQFAATIKNMEKSLLRIKVDESETNGVELSFFLASYSRSPIELKRIEQRWATLIDRAFLQ